MAERAENGFSGGSSDFHLIFPAAAVKIKPDRQEVPHGAAIRKRLISITDEDGKEYELEILSTIEYQGAEYLALVPAEEDEASEELEVSILKSVTEDGEDLLVAVEDEDELAAVYDLLMQSLYEDEEEAEDEEE